MSRRTGPWPNLLESQMFRLTLVFACGVFFAAIESSAETPLVRLKAGLPEGLPGYMVGRDGHIRISDPVKQSQLRCIEKRANIQLDWKVFPAPRLINMLVSNSLDIAFPMGFSDERSEKMMHSIPTWQNPDYLISMNGANMEDKNIHIAARTGSPQHTDYAAHGYTKITPSYTYNELPKVLAVGMADVIIVPKSVYLEFKDQWPPAFTAVQGKDRASGFYINKNDPRNIINTLNAAIGKCS